jgi:hypothetical protein
VGNFQQRKFEWLLFPIAAVQTRQIWGFSGAANGQKQWDGLLLNFTASQCARLKEA